MTTLTLSQSEVIKNSLEKLAPGESLLYRNISWSDYKQLTDELEDWPGKRVNIRRRVFGDYESIGKTRTI